MWWLIIIGPLLFAAGLLFAVAMVQAGARGDRGQR